MKPNYFKLSISQVNGWCTADISYEDAKFRCHTITIKEEYTLAKMIDTIHYLLDHVSEGARDFKTEHLVEKGTLGVGRLFEYCSKVNRPDIKDSIYTYDYGYNEYNAPDRRTWI